jgi:hypothetical protein
VVGPLVGSADEPGLVAVDGLDRVVVVVDVVPGDDLGVQVVHHDHQAAAVLVEPA